MNNNKKEIQKYLQFIKHYSYDTQLYPLQIITDMDLIIDYSEKHHVKLGIIYASDYHIFVVDLVKDKDGAIFPYERLINTHSGNAVVMVPRYHGQYILIKQFRHALGDYQLAFPRGFGEPDLTIFENAEKELSEELNCKCIHAEMIGRTVADSGVCGEKVNIVMCEVDNPSIRINDEGIVNYRILALDEIKSMISQGIINDGYTLSAVAMLLSHNFASFGETTNNR